MVSLTAILQVCNPATIGKAGIHRNIKVYDHHGYIENIPELHILAGLYWSSSYSPGITGLKRCENKIWDNE